MVIKVNTPGFIIGNPIWFSEEFFNHPIGVRPQRTHENIRIFYIKKEQVDIPKTCRDGLNKGDVITSLSSAFSNHEKLIANLPDRVFIMGPLLLWNNIHIYGIPQCRIWNDTSHRT